MIKFNGNRVHRERIPDYSEGGVPKKDTLKKDSLTSKSPPPSPDAPVQTRAWKSKLNEEVCLMRCFLSEEIAVTTYALVRGGFPIIPYIEPLISFPWRPRSWFFEKSTNREVSNYKKLRMKFLNMYGNPGWKNI